MFYEILPAGNAIVMCSSENSLYILLTGVNISKSTYSAVDIYRNAVIKLFANWCMLTYICSGRLCTAPISYSCW